MKHSRLRVVGLSNTPCSRSNATAVPEQTPLSGSRDEAAHTPAEHARQDPYYMAQLQTSSSLPWSKLISLFGLHLHPQRTPLPCLEQAECCNFTLHLYYAVRRLFLFAFVAGCLLTELTCF